jgi:hypothetical protein
MAAMRILTTSLNCFAFGAPPAGSAWLAMCPPARGIVVGAWIQNPAKDLQFSYTDANGVVHPLSVRYVGTPIVVADMNFDGTISGLDWPIFLSGNHRNLSALSAAEAYQMGDLDGDGDNDIYDFALFREAFEAMNPAAGAFAEMVAAYSVPEPGSILLLAAGAAGLAMRRVSSMRRVNSTSPVNSGQAKKETATSRSTRSRFLGV